jgi:hypothetical protein
MLELEFVERFVTCLCHRPHQSRKVAPLGHALIQAFEFKYDADKITTRL